MESVVKEEKKMTRKANIEVRRLGMFEKLKLIGWFDRAKKHNVSKDPDAIRDNLKRELEEVAAEFNIKATLDYGVLLTWTQKTPIHRLDIFSRFV